MIWVVIIVGLIAACLSTVAGRILTGAGVTAIGCLLLRWITGVVFFVTLAKTCAVIMVVVSVGGILLALMH